MLEKAACAFRLRAALVPSMTARFSRDSSIWLLVGQPLAVRALHEGFGAVAVYHLAAVVAEAEFVHVLVQVALANVVIDAGDAALQDAEEAFDSASRIRKRKNVRPRRRRPQSERAR